MSLPAALRQLDVDLPARPAALARLMPLLDDEGADLATMAEVVESDMALASAVVRTVNSALFGLLRRVGTVGEAMQHLGTREVAALTLHHALRAAFTPTPLIERLWDDAGRTALLMGRSAPALGTDRWRAHATGLFARAGQAVLLTHGAPGYAELLQAHAASEPAQLAAAEAARYGIDHAAYGSALCAAWGLAPEVVKAVRERPRASADWAQQGEPVRRLLVLEHGARAWVLAGGAPSVQGGGKTATTGGGPAGLSAGNTGNAATDWPALAALAAWSAQDLHTALAREWARLTPRA